MPYFYSKSHWLLQGIIGWFILQCCQLFFKIMKLTYLCRLSNVQVLRGLCFVSILTLML